MSKTSKTLEVALLELVEGLKESDCVTISDLAELLAKNLPRSYRPYRPYRKTLVYSMKRQEGTNLYSATYQLIDDVTQKRGA